MSHFPIAHVDGPEPKKLSELRAKTDRQVLKLVHAKLQVALIFAALAEETYLEGILDHAERLLRRAKQSVSDVKNLLPVLAEDQHRRVGSQLKKLREALKHLARNREMPRSHTASML